MSIFSRASLIIIAISAPALAIRDPGYYYYPSYYPPDPTYEHYSPPNRNDHSGGAKLNLVEMNRLPSPPVQTRPAYALPVYHHTTAYSTSTYHPPALPTTPVWSPSVVRPDQAHNLLADTTASKLPTDSQVNKPPADDKAYESPAHNQAYRLPVYNHAYRPPVDTPAHKPLAENAVPKLPISLATPTETTTNIPAKETAAYSLEYSLTLDEPTSPKPNLGKPSPLPHILDRRNAPRVPRRKIGKAVKGTTPRGRHTRRFPFLKKRQQAEQRTVVPVTVNMLTGVGPEPSTSSAPTTTITNALPPSQLTIAPGIKVDNSQAALSLHSNPEATTASGGELTPPVPYNGGQQNADLTGEPRDKATVIASVLSIMLGLVVIITIVKLTSNAMRKRKHAVGLGQYDENLGSKEGLIPEMSDQAHFETHNVIITRPDGSEISPLSSTSGDSPSPPPFRAPVIGISSSPLPMPTFAPPPAPASPLSMSFVKLLSPTANLAQQQNLAESRASATSETMSMSTTSTDMSDRERRPTSDDEYLGRQVSHRRMRSAPGSVVWSARSSSATGKLTSGLSGEEGYWESVDVCGSESVGRISRGRSVAMSVMW